MCDYPLGEVDTPEQEHAKQLLHQEKSKAFEFGSPLSDYNSDENYE